ncbi:MAG: cache domain-containing protein [Deltaproteobacteria bacterium]
MNGLFSKALGRIRNISLKWKLLIPFLFFAFAGTTVLTTIGLTSQQKLIKEEEKKGLMRYYQQFLEEINQKKSQAKSLADVIAENPEVQKLLAERKRSALNDLLLPTYAKLRTDFSISQFHFHVPPARSFLRLHNPKLLGETMQGDRPMIIDAEKKFMTVAGLEWGRTGFGIRGVAPIFYENSLVGTVEIGLGFGKEFLHDLYRRWGIDLALFKVTAHNQYTLLAKAGRMNKQLSADSSTLRKGMERPVTLISMKGDPALAALIGPVKDYSGDVVALLEINVDRSRIQERLERTRNLMVTVGLAGIAVSFLLTYLVAVFFIKPIKGIVQEAQDIAEGKRESHLERQSKDEMGTLTQALNVMLDALKERRLEIERYAKTLERKVEERTADLVSSEEKYRTLVENVPLIVYRVLPDGTTEFINSYMTECLGYTVEEAVGDKNFWREKIFGESINTGRESWESWVQNRAERRTERFIRNKKGRLLTFIDHAMPVTGPDGKVLWIDGIMMDISELKGLQERAMRAEEFRILGEISAHMAHEIRNPLIAAGGFARRLRDALRESDPNRRLAQIIVDEVARLENFLKILISSIRPFDLSLAEVDVNELLRSWLTELDEHVKSKNIDVVTHLPSEGGKIQGDEEKLNQAFKNLLKHAVVSTPEGGRLFVSSTRLGDRFVVTLRHKVEHLSKDEMERFFFPHIENEREWTVIDLPFSKIVIHRHGGKVDLMREGENTLVMRIDLPIKHSMESAV